MRVLACVRVCVRERLRNAGACTEELWRFGVHVRVWESFGDVCTSGILEVVGEIR